jgi:hypothetical protein
MGFTFNKRATTDILNNLFIHKNCKDSFNIWHSPMQMSCVTETYRGLTAYLDTGLLNGDYPAYFNIGKGTKGDVSHGKLLFWGARIAQSV